MDLCDDCVHACMHVIEYHLKGVYFPLSPAASSKHHLVIMLHDKVHVC